MRALIKFSKTGAAKYISHLDLMRAVQRAFRRSGLPMAYSQGYNPHMLLSFATALSLGCQSIGEVMDVELAQDVPEADIAARLSANCPPGIAVLGCRAVPAKAVSRTQVMSEADYEVRLSADCRAAAEALLASGECMMDKQTKKGVRRVDIRPLVLAVSASDDGKTLHMTLRHSEQLALKPELLLEAMGAPRPYDITRTGLFCIQNGKRRNIFDYTDDVGGA